MLATLFNAKSYAQRALQIFVKYLYTFKRGGGWAGHPVLLARRIMHIVRHSSLANLSQKHIAQKK